MSSFWIVFGVLLVASLECQAATNVTPDYFTLVRQWGPSYCATANCNTAPVAAFTVHGLWPQRYQGGYLNDCDPSNKFSTDNIPDTLENQMKCEWVSYTGSNAGFWSYEWGKHGTCGVAILPTQEEYFSTSIALNNQYEANDALSAAGFTPGSGKSFPPSQVSDALKKAWGAKPVISCSSSTLFEVWSCFDNDMKIMDCPSSLNGRSCPSYVTLPKGSAVPAACKSYYSPSGSSSSSGAGSLLPGSGSSNSGSGSSSMYNGAAASMNSSLKVVVGVVVAAVLAIVVV